MRIKNRQIKWIIYNLCALIFIFCMNSPVLASNRIVNLTVAYKTVYFAGKPRRAIAVNNQIPAPTLHFKNGDHVTINVYNHLKKRGTGIHWHGLIVPWRMDGVPGVTQKLIPPGGVFHYIFTLHQSGTYWYHAHAEFQEQEGLYGGIIIDPKRPRIHSNKDFVVVLSDWSNTNPDTVYANLKKDGDYYSIKMPMQASLVQYFRDLHNAKTARARQTVKSAYKMMQTMRMSIYDYSDVAYDAFLLNGHPATSPWTAEVKVGDTVRLRFIGAGASSIFNVKIPGATMTMVQADGQNVKPFRIKKFNIAPGETFDVLVKIKKRQPYIIYAESIDSLGAAVGALLTYPGESVDYKAVRPFPKPKPIMMMGTSMSMPGMTMNKNMPQSLSDNTSNMKMVTHGNHSNMSATSSSHQAPTNTPLSSKTKYDKLISLTKTNNPNHPVHIIPMELYGYMDHYIWFLNGIPEYKAKPIMIKHGEWYRVVFTNETMMHHPMHIHGHWFIIRNGHGAYAPRLHTIDVPPGATVVADFYANESGQWFFHCHNLLHMKAGMANIFRYSNNPKQDFIGLSGHKARGLFLANQVEMSGDFFHNRYKATLNTLLGSDYNKLQLYAKDAEIENGKVANANIDVFYWRLISQFWALKAGINTVYRPAAKTYVQPGIGIEGLFPYFIKLDLRSYVHDGSVKLDVDLSRDSHLTHHVFLKLGVESIFATKTVTKDEIGSGLNALEWTVQPYYQFTPSLSLFLQYQRKDYYSSLKNIMISNAESISENSYNVGLDLLF